MCDGVRLTRSIIVVKQISILRNCASNRFNVNDILKERLEEYTEDFKEKDWEDFIGEETEGEVLHGFSGYISFDDGQLEADTCTFRIK